MTPAPREWISPHGFLEFLDLLATGGTETRHHDWSWDTEATPIGLWPDGKDGTALSHPWQEPDGSRTR